MYRAFDPMTGWLGHKRETWEDAYRDAYQHNLPGTLLEARVYERDGDNMRRWDADSEEYEMAVHNGYYVKFCEPNPAYDWQDDASEVAAIDAEIRAESSDEEEWDYDDEE